MKFNHLTVIVALLFLPQVAGADGFKLKLEGNTIVGKNTENSIPDYLFGHNFDFTNNIDGTYESSHGSVDANDPGSGFNFPAGGPNDSFTYNIRGLWTFSAGVALPATPGVTLDILKASNGTPIAEIDGPIATPESFSISATTTHELIWSVPQASTADVLGLAYTISGTSAVNGQAYEESKPFIVVQWTPQFAGDVDDAMQVIYQAAINRLTGDFNGDGDVDAADYTVWRNGLDSAFLQADYDVWKSHFGQTVGGPGSGTGGFSVPEPLNVSLAACAVACILLRRATIAGLSARRGRSATAPAN